MTAEKITSIWLIFVGISIALLWLILFATNSVNETDISFVLHLTAEAITAIFGLYVGVSSLFGKKSVRPTMFFALGLMVASSAGAGGYYLAEMGDLAFFMLLESIALITALLFVILYVNEQVFLAGISIGSQQMDAKFSKFVNFALGLAVYTTLNSSTYFGESGNWIMVLIHVVTAISLLYIHISATKGKKVLSTHDSTQQVHS